MYEVESDTESSQYGALMVLDVDFDDEGTYTCTVSNVFQSESASALLIVQGNVLKVPSGANDFTNIVKVSVIFNGLGKYAMNLIY